MLHATHAIGVAIELLEMIAIVSQFFGPKLGLCLQESLDKQEAANPALWTLKLSMAASRLTLPPMM